MTGVDTAEAALRPPQPSRLLVLSFLLVIPLSPSFAMDAKDPESVLRALVKANAEKDLTTMSRYMSHEVDTIGYTIGGRKYVGWQAFADEINSEFASVTHLELPILDLRLWKRGDVAWFAMELDYVRHIATAAGHQRTVIPLRETGVLERQEDRWILVAWHESRRVEGPQMEAGVAQKRPLRRTADSSSQPAAMEAYDLSGEWEILEIEENKTYRATLDQKGNGPYTWQGGQFFTSAFKDRRWEGSWKQTGNDREGNFELVLSEDGTQAKGIWWYVRVGKQNNIPPRQHGGSYVWKRLTPPPSAQ
jgi:SnoaL-like domain